MQDSSWNGNVCSTSQKFTYIANISLVITSTEAKQCSGVEIRNGTSGILQDHTGAVGASNYTNNASCAWSLAPFNVSSGRLKLDFYIFSLLEGDTLTIRDGTIYYKTINNLIVNPS